MPELVSGRDAQHGGARQSAILGIIVSSCNVPAVIWSFSISSYPFSILRPGQNPSGVQRIGAHRYRLPGTGKRIAPWVEILSPTRLGAHIDTDASATATAGSSPGRPRTTRPSLSTRPATLCNRQSPVNYIESCPVLPAVNPEDAWTRFAISDSKFDGLIVRAGEGITNPLGQSSARWQVLRRTFFDSGEEGVFRHFECTERSARTRL
jgi:hypothetical protein